MKPGKTPNYKEKSSYKKQLHEMKENTTGKVQNETYKKMRI